MEPHNIHFDVDQLTTIYLCSVVMISGSYQRSNRKGELYNDAFDGTCIIFLKYLIK